MSVRPDDRIVRRFRGLAQAGASSCICLGLLVLLGWALGIEPLKTVLPGAASMKPDTALSMVLLGISLSLRLDSRASRWRNSVALACVGLTVAIASVTLCEYLFPDAFPPPGSHPGRMASATAFVFILLGASLLCLQTDRPTLAQAFALPAGFTSAAAMFGYAFQARSLYQVAGFSAVAIHTAVGQNVLFLSILLGSADRGFMRRISSAGPGGMAARRLLLPALLLFPMLGFLRLAGQKAGWYGLEFGTAALTLGYVFVFGAIVLWAAGRADRQEEARLAGQEELTRRSVELARSNADLEQFAYVASHDLQEPLRMIASYLELIERRYKGKLDQDADEFIGFAVDGAKRLQILIQDLLAYSRLTTRAVPPEPVNSEVVLDEAVQDLGVTIQDSDARITHDPLPTVVVDRGQLAQVFRNLLGNALKFRSEAVPRVHVTALREGAEWKFSVGDNGIGLEPQHSDRVFRMFQRLHTREEYPGTGIGLAVCKKVVERHGGRIWVESEPGAGSKFFFTLPVRGGNGA